MALVFRQSKSYAPALGSCSADFSISASAHRKQVDAEIGMMLNCGAASDTRKFFGELFGAEAPAPRAWLAKSAAFHRRARVALM